MPQLVSLLYWKVSVSAALKSFVSCPKRICAWWADVADIASSMTFSDGNVSAVSRPLNTFRWNPLVTAEGVEQHPVSLTDTHTHARSKAKNYSAIMTCWCMQHTHISWLHIPTSNIIKLHTNITFHTNFLQGMLIVRVHLFVWLGFFFFLFFFKTSRLMHMCMRFRWRCTTQTRKGVIVQEAALTTACLIRVWPPSISTAWAVCTAIHR